MSQHGGLDVSCFNKKECVASVVLFVACFFFEENNFPTLERYPFLVSYCPGLGRGGGCRGARGEGRGSTERTDR